MKYYKIYLFLIVVFFSCEKDPILINGNIPPPDYTIEEEYIENYITKLYISLLGIEPTENEFNNAKNTLLSSGCSKEDRIIIIEDIMNNDLYSHHMFRLNREDYLNAVDTFEIGNYINLYELLIENETLTTNDTILIIYLQEELNRLINLKNCPFEYLNLSINTIEIHKRCAHNIIYDEINMGTENFVVSIFQNFFHRYPTAAELYSASNMADGNQSTIFNTNGSSKKDFIDIIFASYNYYEGQVKKLYNRYLFRDPTSKEMSSLSILFNQTQNYQKIQQEILILNEFFGL